MEKYSSIIFDLDGTLYDMDKIGLKMILNTPAEIFHINKARKAKSKLKGCFFDSREKFLQEYYGALSKHLGISSEEAGFWEENTFYPNFINVLKKFSPRPGIKDFIEKSQAACAVLSDYDKVDERLIALGIDPTLFIKRMYSGELGGLKPNPSVFSAAAGELGCRAKEVLVIGDDEVNDGQGALGAGMDFLLIDDKIWETLRKDGLSAGLITTNGEQ